MQTNNLRAVVCVLCVTTAFACDLVCADEKTQPPMPTPKPPGAVRQPAEKKFPVDLKKVPWDEVLDWYAKVSGLKADLKVKPKGMLTIRGGNRQFTVAEITDLLNEALAQQKLLLIPHYKSFVVVSVDGKSDPKFTPAVELQDLPKLPRSAVVEVAISIPPGLGASAEDVADEVKKLLTPFGELLYAKDKWIIVRDTAGNIQRMLAVLEAAANGIIGGCQTTSGPTSSTPWCG